MGSVLLLVINIVDDILLYGPDDKLKCLVHQLYRVFKHGAKSYGSVDSDFKDIRSYKQISFHVNLTPTTSYMRLKCILLIALAAKWFEVY